MKKYFRRVFPLLAALLSLCSVRIPVFAQGSVSYEGQAQKFVFSSGSSESPTDLFDGFKDVMPGDSRTQSIVIKNNQSNVNVVIYLRAQGAQNGSEDFLSQLKLTAKQSGTSTLYSAPANETAQLTDWVNLGQIAPGGTITLNVTLEVPADLDDSFQNSIGYINWQFKAEEIPITTSSSSGKHKHRSSGDTTTAAVPTLLPQIDSIPGFLLPLTGDSNHIVLWLVLASASLAAIWVLFWNRRRKKE
jgi:LPXTG-motif cell wall-anchored protein